MKNLLSIIVISLLLAGISGCNTLAGLGEDAKAVVGKIRGTDKTEQENAERPTVEAADKSVKE